MGLRSVNRWGWFVGVSVLAGVLSAAAQSRDQMMLVHLRWESNQVSVLRAEVVPGRLKQPIAREGAFLVRLADAQGNSVWSSYLQDPHALRFEFPDEGSAGKLKRIELTAPTMDTMVKVPVKDKAVEFQLLGAPTAVRPAGGAASALVNIPGEPANAARPILLRHRIPATKPQHVPATR